MVLSRSLLVTHVFYGAFKCVGSVRDGGHRRWIVWSMVVRVWVFEHRWNLSGWDLKLIVRRQGCWLDIRLLCFDRVVSFAVIGKTNHIASVLAEQRERCKTRASLSLWDVWRATEIWKKQHARTPPPSGQRKSTTRDTRRWLTSSRILDTLGVALLRDYINANSFVSTPCVD